jgi:hypothetical protein
VAGFLFMACAIDYLAGLWCGQQTEPATYRAFIDQYFRPVGRYNSNELYVSLRNGLVHNFTTKDSKYILVFGRSTEHLTSKPGTNRLYLDGQIFRDDLVNAKNLFFDDVLLDPNQLRKVAKRYNNVGFLALED